MPVDMRRSSRVDLAGAAGASAGQADLPAPKVKAAIELARDDGRAIRSQLATGMVVDGIVSRGGARSFEVENVAGSPEQVRYADVRSFLDPVSGQVMARVNPESIDSPVDKFHA